MRNWRVCIAPRALVIEASRGPEVAGPPAITAVHKEGACPNGKLLSPPLDSVKQELERARPIFASLKADGKLQLVVSEDGRGQPGSEKALQALLGLLGVRGRLQPLGKTPVDARSHYDPEPLLHSQFDQLVGFTQALIRKSPDRRKEFWAKADSSSLERWRQSTKFYRDNLWDEVIGRLPSPSLPANPRTRLVYDAPKFKGYEVVLDVWPEVIAYGVLLVPKDIKPGERRPVGWFLSMGWKVAPRRWLIRRSTRTTTIILAPVWLTRGLSPILLKIPTSGRIISESFNAWAIPSSWLYTPLL